MSEAWGLRIQQKHDTEVNWDKASEFIPMDGEIVVYDAEKPSDTRPSNRNFPCKGPRMKVGDGETKITDLLFVNEEISKIYADRYAYETYYNMLKQLTEIEDMPDICVIPEGSKNVIVNLLPEVKIYVFPWGVEHIQGTFRDTVEYVAFPNTLQELPQQVFNGCSRLMSIVIPDSVKTIGYSAFQNCTSLTSVTIGNGVTAIDGYMFRYCTSLTSIIIPDSVTSIRDYAFEGCSSLTRIELSNSITSIGYGVFQGCSALTNIKIPDGVTSISYYVFEGCSSLTSIVIPDSVKTISGQAFYECNNLTDVSYTGTQAQWNAISINPNGNSEFNNATKHYSTKDLEFSGFTFSIDSSNTSYELTNYSGARTDVYIPSTYHGLPVKKIDNYAFSNCTSLTSVVIPDSVTEIGHSAFGYCDSLTSINIPDSVTTIANYAFEDCHSLTSVTIGNGVTAIGSYAFENCSSLESITIPFVGATKNGTNNTHFGYLFGAPKYGDNKDYVPSSLKTVVITGGDIDTSAFQSCNNIKQIIVKDNVRYVRSQAFQSCTNLANLEILCNVESIGNGILSGCSYLRNLTLPYVGCKESNYSIDDSDYYNMLFGYIFGTSSFANTEPQTQYWLTSAKEDNKKTKRYYIPKSLSSITINGNIPPFGFTKSGVSHVTISEGVTKLNDNAFYDCSSLEYISLPSTLKTIGSYAFFNCSGAAKNQYSNAKYIGTRDNPYFYLYEDKSSTVSTCEIHPLTRVIGGSAFKKNSNLTEITIPSHVTQIHAYAFYDCSKLANVRFQSSELTNINMYAFCGCTKLQELDLTFASKLKIIDKRAFKDCTQLSNIKLPDSLEQIADWAFYNINTYDSSGNTLPKEALFLQIRLPYNINKIGIHVFGYDSNYRTTLDNLENEAVPGTRGGCAWEIPNVKGWFNVSLTNTSLSSGVVSLGQNLNYVVSEYVIPYNVKILKSSVFANFINNFQRINIPDSVTTIDDYAFYKCSSLTSVTIPNSVTEIGNSAFYGCSSLTDVYYNGTQEQWNAISIGSNNGYLTSATIHYPQ